MLASPMTAVCTVVDFVTLLRHPTRLDVVIRMADRLATVGPTMDEIRTTLGATEEGRAAFRDRPRLGPVDVAALLRLPEGTLGRAYATHLVKNGLDPAALPVREARDDAGYVMAHLYETHDVWHAVTGFDADIAGEVGLQAFYLAQMPDRFSALLVAGGLLQATLFAFDDHGARMEALVRGWTLGRKARPLFGVKWAERWEEPLAEVRRGLGLA